MNVTEPYDMRVICDCRRCMMEPFTRYEPITETTEYFLWCRECGQVVKIERVKEDK